jgi:hypothetical protein
MVVTEVTQQLTGLSLNTFTTACPVGSAARDEFNEVMRMTVKEILRLPNLRDVLYMYVVQPRRRLQQQGKSSRSLASSDYVTIMYGVQTTGASTTSATVESDLKSAVSSGSFTSLMRTLASAKGVAILASVSAGSIDNVKALKTPSPVIYPTFSPTVQTPIMWLAKWYVPWSVACAVLGTLILYACFRYYRWREKMYEEEMQDLEDRKRRADELLARRFAPGITNASAPHITRMRDNFKVILLHNFTFLWPSHLPEFFIIPTLSKTNYSVNTGGIPRPSLITMSVMSRALISLRRTTEMTTAPTLQLNAAGVDPHEEVHPRVFTQTRRLLFQTLDRAV